MIHLHSSIGRSIGENKHSEQARRRCREPAGILLLHVDPRSASHRDQLSPSRHDTMLAHSLMIRPLQLILLLQISGHQPLHHETQGLKSPKVAGSQLKPRTSHRLRYEQVSRPRLRPGYLYGTTCTRRRNHDITSIRRNSACNQVHSCFNGNLHSLS